MNKKINNVILFSAIASILLLLIIFIVDYVAALDSPHIYVIKREQAIWEIFIMLSYAILAFWALGSQKRVIAVIGSVVLLISNFYFLIFPYRMGIGYSNIIVAYAAPCASVILLIATFLKKRNKILFMLPLVVLAVLDLLEIFTMIHSMLSIRFFNFTWVIRGFANGFTIIFFIALSVYVMIDGKPFEKRMMLRKEYIHEKVPETISLTDQLNQIKSDFESGKITADEYKERRMNLLKK